MRSVCPCSVCPCSVEEGSGLQNCSPDGTLASMAGDPLAKPSAPWPSWSEPRPEAAPKASSRPLQPKGDPCDAIGDDAIMWLGTQLGARLDESCWLPIRRASSRLSCEEVESACFSSIDRRSACSRLRHAARSFGVSPSGVGSCRS